MIKSQLSLILENNFFFGSVFYMYIFKAAIYLGLEKKIIEVNNTKSK